MAIAARITPSRTAIPTPACLLSESKGRTSLMRLQIGLALLSMIATFGGTAGAAPTTPPESIALPGDRAFPESISSTKDGTLYVGSLASGGIYRIAPHS